MIMLGALVNIIEFVSKQAIINALRETVSDKHLSEDQMAVEAGIKFGAARIG